MGTFCWKSMGWGEERHRQRLFHFRNQSLTTKRPKYWKSSIWIPPEPNSTNLALFLERTQNLIHNPPLHVTRRNLVSQQSSTIRKLGSNQPLVIKPFDKGSWICLMDTFIYISKIEDHLADPSTCKKLNFHPTQVIRNVVFSTLDYLYNIHRIDDISRHHLMPPKPACTPLFYDLPKVHKPQ